MAETNSGELMREMNTYLNEAESAQNDADPALPFESISDYLGDPNGFGDVTAKLWKKVSIVFDLAVKFNRHSPDYLKSLAQLEKGIKFLGSSCLQKYALEQKKHVFPGLGQLNTANLYTMASIHFNKIDRALSEYIEQKQTVDDALLDMEYRYYHLMERIRATEVKIHNYNDKRYSGQEDYNPVVHGLAFSDKSWTKSQHEHDEPMAFQRAKAFSVAGGQCSVVSGQCSAKSEIGNQKSEIESVNEEGSMKNEEFSSERSSENEWMVREQFSRKKSEISAQDSVTSGQCSAKSEIGSVNEDGRVKKEEDSVSDGQDSGAGCQFSGISEQDAASEKKSLLTPNSSLLITPEPPEFIKILERVSMRSRLHNLDYLGFTETEMRQLVADPDFAQFQPEMAAEMRAALEEHDSG